MRAITQYLSRQGYSTVDDGYYRQINKWAKWYHGKVSSVHTYKQYNGLKRITRTRKSLGMAKKVCEDWASLQLNDKVEIVISDDAVNQAVHETLDANNFWVRGNQLVELAYALGTGALVEYKDGDKVRIDYIRAGMINPIAWDNGRITECAFATECTRNQDRLVYLNIHRMDGGKYIVDNKMFKRCGNTLIDADLPNDVEETVHTGSDVPLYQIITPNIVNNIDLDCPMGISVYANALDELEGLDLVYDSYVNEFRLGKKRIMVPITMARIIQQEDGTTNPVFDDSDTEFFAFEASSNDDGQKITEINMQLRHEAHEAALKTSLNLVSTKCGLGNDRYKFEADNVKTATEVVSEKSDLYQNLKKHERVLRSAIIGMCRAIASLLGLSTDWEITVNFDDSIIEDRPAEQLRDMQQVRDGLMAVWEYRVKYFGETEEDAKAMAAELSSTSEEDVDPFGFNRAGGVTDA